MEEIEMEIKDVSFDGLKAIEMSTDKIKLIIVTEVGPRIAFLGRTLDEDNILYWDIEGASKEEWKLYGGHRVWLTRPFADESEDTYASDNEPCFVEITENSVTVTAPVHAFTKLERGIKVEFVNNTQFKVINFIKNAGNMIYSGGVWSPTCINPEGKELHIPLGEENTTWDIVNIVIPRVFAGNTLRLDDPQVTMTEDELVVKSQGQICKRCAMAPKGETYMVWPEKELVFRKKTKYVRGGNYPLGGCNVAVFVGQDNWMGELESFGVESPIRPGETIYNEELWSIESV